MTKKFGLHVAIYLRGDTLDPDLVSRRLGVLPSRSQRKGEKRLLPDNREVATKTGMWTLSLEKDSNAIDLSEAVEQLINEIGAQHSTLTSIPGVEEAYLDVFISTAPDSDGEGNFEFQLTERNIGALQALGLPVHFTVAVIRP